MSTQHSVPPQHTLPPIHGATSPHGIQPQHQYSTSSNPPPSHQQRHPAPLSLATQNPESLNYPGYNTVAPPPPSPSQASEVADDSNYNLPEIPPVSRVWRNYVWALQIVQQPIRARMCGFGDKDRRPISPPPCIRLIIFDPVSGNEIDYSKVSDLSCLVLNVDLWNLSGTREDNLVRHNNASPSISSVSTSAFVAPVNPPTSISSKPSPYSGEVPYGPVPPTPAFSPVSTSSGSLLSPDDPIVQGNGMPGYHHRNPMHPYDHHPSPYQNGYPPNYNSQAAIANMPPGMSSSSSARSSQDFGAPRDMSERPLIAKNLIGSSSSSAFKLADEDGKVGLWFVLQDLSVRTEGWFRLKLSFFNLSAQEITAGVDAPQGDLLTEAPCLSSIFSRPFKVFSAKKFPGVIETTSLSRQFAQQGIKIPIRKDGHGKKRRRDGEDDDDDDEGDYDD
ncbi:hypothetical protein B0A52_07948 [Exophiala mesophila]|uniref:Velvet domain-containing protein n=1 Tax=Exophiala mesophila TaxID=212818 RepID=A0A438MZF0_EXOME|nr:hypothetical protein B0A52_07948 [Exophiala mesophila]